MYTCVSFSCQKPTSDPVRTLDVLVANCQPAFFTNISGDCIHRLNPAVFVMSTKCIYPAIIKVIVYHYIHDKGLSQVEPAEIWPRLREEHGRPEKRGRPQNSVNQTLKVIDFFQFSQERSEKFSLRVDGSSVHCPLRFLSAAS
jgi:hypothetical protein